MDSLDKRVKKLNQVEQKTQGPVIYIMSRDQRVQNNPAFLAAQRKALEEKKALAVIFNLFPRLGERTKNHFLFMLEGLKEVEKELRELNVPFLVFPGTLTENWEEIIKKLEPSFVYFDFSPLRKARNGKERVAQKADCGCFVVDAHNIVPVWAASEKQEWAAWTFRKKIKEKLPFFLKKIPSPEKHPYSIETKAQNDWQKLENSIKAPFLKGYQLDFKPGRSQALKTLNVFLNERLTNYSKYRNNPNKEAASDLSPYLHFGQISSLYLALEVKNFKEGRESRELQESKEEFLEELIVRKELSDNFCFYNDQYDSFQGAPDWAKETLDSHLGDPRDYRYSLDQWESMKIHCPVWNACQKEMTETGKMHGYMRMFWAKKILEWSRNPQKAIDTAIYLNDKYELDGGDPNGYVGIMWSIAGVHDRAWPERKVFGKVRYMNAEGLKRKFDLKKYIERWAS
ncbi:MAG: deoxyribodipyrimidine photo-lyase [Candidatus Nealsonbacteria bacterium]|nr:deoxyribodipyrimidine photo-lyase [Candidatus Nealsonbacteria bacterium]